MAAEDSVDVRSLVGRLCRARRAAGRSLRYPVRGWYLDPNGCFKTYGDGHAESFCDLSTYDAPSREQTR